MRPYHDEYTSNSSSRRPLSTFTNGLPMFNEFQSSKVHSPKRAIHVSLKMESMSDDAPRPNVKNSGGSFVSTRSLNCALRPIIIVAQLFAVFPVNNVTSPDVSNLKFTWWSLKIVYSCLSILGSIILTAFSAHRLTITPITSKKMTDLVFYFTASASTVLFLKLARQWPSFAVSWENMERVMSRHNSYRQPNVINLKLKLKIWSISIILLFLVEYGLSIVFTYVSALEHSNRRGDIDIVAAYFVLRFPMLTLTNFSLWKGLIMQLSGILSSFSRFFKDLFLILISVALTDQFKLLNNRLNAARGKMMPEWWWAEARIDFNSLAEMTRRVDSQISALVLLSLSSNLYFICTTLLKFFRPTTNTFQKIYCFFCLGSRLAKVSAVSLCAAAVHDESSLPAPILYSVSSSNYSMEVSRFLTQVTTDTVRLTGMKFFAITRRFILTVAGTIITYELVLLRFNAFENDNQLHAINITKFDQ